MTKIFQAVALGGCLVLASIMMQGCGCDEDDAKECGKKCSNDGDCASFDCMLGCIKDNNCCDDDMAKDAKDGAAAAGCNACD